MPRQPTIQVPDDVPNHLCTPDLTTRCFALDWVIGDRKGQVELHQLVHVPTGKRTRLSVSARSDARHQAIEFRLCPFCGVKFNGPGRDTAHEAPDAVAA